MLLPNEGVDFILSHSSQIIGVFHFEIDQPNHFMSLSDNGEMIEWIFNQENSRVVEISKFFLERPSNDLLMVNKHKIRPLQKGQYYKITKVIQFENFLVLGYSDGVILVYQVCVRESNNKKKEEKEKKEEKKEEEKEEKKENEEEKSASGGG